MTEIIKQKWKEGKRKGSKERRKEGKEGIKNLDTDYINVPDMVCIFFLLDFLDMRLSIFLKIFRGVEN